CRAARVLCRQIATEWPRVRHVEVDAESHLAEVRALGVWRTPTVFLVDRLGRIVGRITGVPRRDQLLAAIRPLLTEGEPGWRGRSGGRPGGARGAARPAPPGRVRGGGGRGGGGGDRGAGGGGGRFAAGLTTLVFLTVLATGSGWLALAQAVVFAVTALRPR